MPEQSVRHIDVAEAFDSIALKFESTFENAVTASIRQTVYKEIRNTARRGSAILDINCGVGIDAMALAADGYAVTGIDLSVGMIEQARRRAAASPELNIEFLVASFEDLTVLKGRTYDVVLSNFAGLNCTNGPEKVFQHVASVLNPGGHFLAIVMPKVCLWEIVAGLVRLRPGAAFRRFRRNTQASGFDRHSFMVYYHPVRRFLSMASGWFDPIFVRALSLLGPPPHAQTFRNRNPRLSRFLDNLDERIGAFPVLRGMGDHYLVHFQRHGAPAQRPQHE